MFLALCTDLLLTMSSHDLYQHWPVLDLHLLAVPHHPIHSDEAFLHANYMYHNEPFRHANYIYMHCI